MYLWGLGSFGGSQAVCVYIGYGFVLLKNLVSLNTPDTEAETIP